MEVNKSSPEIKTKEKVNYGALISFFVFELLAITAFTLANSVIIYSALALLFLVLILVIGIKDFKITQSADFFIFLIPLFIFAALTAFSAFSFKNISILLINIFSLLGVMSFALVGFLSRKMEGFKISNALLVIYGAIALLVLISFIMTMINYVPFYALIYRGKYFYYNGMPLTAYTDANQLMGFAFKDVSLEYYSLFSVLLLTSIVALRFISFKENKREFFIYLSFAVLGFISCLFTLNEVSLITLPFVILFLLFVTFYPKKDKPMKIVKIIFYVLLALIGITFVLFFLNAQESWSAISPLQNLIKSNSVLNKVFNGNRISAAIKAVLSVNLKDLLLGYGGNAYNIFKDKMLSNSIIFDSILTSGLIGVIALIVFIVFVTRSLKRYYSMSEDSPVYKHLVIAFIGTFFIYSILSLDSSPETHSLYIQPATSNPMFLITVFLIGYSFTARKSKKAIEVITNEEA